MLDGNIVGLVARHRRRLSEHASGPGLDGLCGFFGWLPAAAVGLVVVGLLAGCGGEESHEEVIRVTAEDFYFLPSRFQLELEREASYTLVLANEGSTEHALLLLGPGRTTVSPVAAGGEKGVPVTLEPGRYRFYCPIRNHRHHGMEGTLRVDG